MSKKTDTVLSEEIIFEQGLIKGCGTVRIDGKFSGTINIEGHVVLGETGVIEGSITSDTAVLAGKLNGDVFIKDTLRATSTADISGKIEAGKLIVDEGAVFDGTFNITKESGKKITQPVPPVQPVNPPVPPAKKESKTKNK